jgi:hypothetical protein
MAKSDRTGILVAVGMLVVALGIIAILKLVIG